MKWDALSLKLIHEIKTPLQTILSFSELLQKEPLQEPALTYVNYLLKNAHYLQELATSLTLFRHRERDFPLTSLSVADFFGDLKALLADFLALKEIVLSFTHTTETFRTNPLLIKQIAFNLLKNAIQATPRQKHILLSLEALPQEGYRLSVEDQGSGMSLSQINAVSSYLPLENSLENPHNHLGLGLSIVKEAVNLLKGTLEVTLTPSGGTRFRIDFLFK